MVNYMIPEPIKIRRIDGRIFVSLGEKQITGVTGYSIENSPDGGEDLTLKIHVSGACIMSHEIEAIAPAWYGIDIGGGVPVAKY